MRSHVVRALVALSLAFAACNDDAVAVFDDDAAVSADDLGSSLAPDGGASDLSRPSGDSAVVSAADLAGATPPDAGSSGDLSSATNNDLASGGTPDLANLGNNDLASGGARDLASVAADLLPPPDMAVAPLADPGKPGSLSTVQFDLTVPVATGLLGGLNVTVYGPSDDGTSLSTKGAPYPLIVFSPGFSVSRKAYGAYSNRLATHGFLVVAQDYRNSGDHTQDRDDTVKLISWLLAPTGNDAARVMGRPDPNRIGVTGHSLGGKISFLAAEADPRVKAAFGIDPVNSNPPLSTAISALTGLPGYKGATGFLGETLSSTGLIACAPTSDNYQQFYMAANSPTFAIKFEKAAHNDFVDQSQCLQCALACPGSQQSWQTVNALGAKFTTAFFRQKLLGDVGQSAYLTGPYFQADATANSLSLQVK